MGQFDFAHSILQLAGHHQHRSA